MSKAAGIEAMGKLDFGALAAGISPPPAPAVKRAAAREEPHVVKRGHERPSKTMKRRQRKNRAVRLVDMDQVRLNRGDSAIKRRGQPAQGKIRFARDEPSRNRIEPATQCQHVSGVPYNARSPRVRRIEMTSMPAHAEQ